MFLLGTQVFCTLKYCRVSSMLLLVIPILVKQVLTGDNSK
jgi:hypothetical protein